MLYTAVTALAEAVDPLSLEHMFPRVRHLTEQLTRHRAHHLGAHMLWYAFRPIVCDLLQIYATGMLPPSIYSDRAHASSP